MTYRHSLYLAPLLYLFAFLISAIQPVTAATFVVTSTADAGLGSLRQAIQSANSLPGPDLIQFNIPGTGVHTIVAGSDLPFVTDSLTIDGTSQPGYSGKPLIVLTGLAGRTAYGFGLIPGNCVVRALTINGFASVGVLVYGSGNIIEGCFIGTDSDGVQAVKASVVIHEMSWMLLIFTRRKQSYQRHRRSLLVK